MKTDRKPASEALVLVTNDDGIASPGLIALAHKLESRGFAVLVAAPSADMSGAAAAIGPVDPHIPAQRVEIEGIDRPAFAVEAPPAMIVIAALGGAFGAVPTAVASGVNAGVNLGRAILHSGTVGAALTGHNLGLPSVAVSMQTGGKWDVAADFGVEVFEQLLDANATSMANVNVPKDAEITTERVSTKLARFGAVTASIAGDLLDFQLTIDPNALDEPGTDAAAVRAGQVSVTWLSGFAGYAGASAEFSLREVTPDSAGVEAAAVNSRRAHSG